MPDNYCRVLFLLHKICYFSFIEQSKSIKNYAQQTFAIQKKLDDNLIFIIYFFQWSLFLLVRKINGKPSFFFAINTFKNETG